MLNRYSVGFEHLPKQPSDSYTTGNVCVRVTAKVVFFLSFLNITRTQTARDENIIIDIALKSISMLANTERS